MPIDPAPYLDWVAYATRQALEHAGVNGYGEVRVVFTDPQPRAIVCSGVEVGLVETRAEQDPKARACALTWSMSFAVKANRVYPANAGDVLAVERPHYETQALHRTYQALASLAERVLSGAMFGDKVRTSGVELQALTTANESATSDSVLLIMRVPLKVPGDRLTRP